VLNKNGVSLDNDRIQALIDSPIPKSCRDVRGILGGLQMLRRFEPKIAEYTNILNPLTSEFNWTDKEAEAWLKLKELLKGLDAKNFRIR
jgi:hypothetical protein